MIVKLTQRAGAKALADHLTNAQDNERVEIGSAAGIARPGDVHAALGEMEAISRGFRCRNHMAHVMLNPEKPLSPEQWLKAWEMVEKEYGLNGHRHIEVCHEKEGRFHVHRVYDRLDDHGKAVQLSFSHMRNEKLGRLMEYEFGHDLTTGKHNRAVIGQLRKEGRGEVADWMEHGKAHETARPVAEVQHGEHQQEKRTGIAARRVKADLADAWQRSDTGQGFEAALADKGYLLARGDRRAFVLVDELGEVHSAKLKGVKSADIQKRCEGLPLPSVEEARSFQEERQKLAAERAEPERPAMEELESYQEPTRERDEPDDEESGSEEGEAGGAIPPANAPEKPEPPIRPLNHIERALGIIQRAVTMLRDTISRLGKGRGGEEIPEHMPEVQHEHQSERGSEKPDRQIIGRGAYKPQQKSKEQTKGAYRPAPAPPQKSGAYKLGQETPAPKPKGLEKDDFER